MAAVVAVRVDLQKPLVVVGDAGLVSKIEL
jgi:hypothetical protein